MGAAQSEASMKALEYRITQGLLHRVSPDRARHSASNTLADTGAHTGAEKARLQRSQLSPAMRLGDRIIAVLAVTVSLVIAGSFLEELVWVLLAAATLYALGYDA